MTLSVLRRRVARGGSEILTVTWVFLREGPFYRVPMTNTKGEVLVPNVLSLEGLGAWLLIVGSW